MKKVIFTFLVALFAVAIVNAQDLTSKKGVPILPQEGDYGLGISATPFLVYAGNLLNGTAGQGAPGFNFTAEYPMAIYGKYFKSANMAYRGALRIGFNNMSDKEYVVEDGQADPTVTVEDKYTNTQMDIVLMFGIENRRGHGRVQGIYGAQVFLGYGSFKDKYEYGNSFTTTNTTPESYDFYPLGPDGNPYDNIQPAPGVVPGSGPASSRVTEVKGGSQFSFGVSAFVGVEYFFAPCMSLGGEFAWGIGFMTVGDSEATVETWDAANNAKKETTNEYGGESRFSVDTDVLGAGPSGAINLNFYF
ncbi:MAG: hypothetical protein R6T99_10475 [Bacteroidales bacterium]